MMPRGQPSEDSKLPGPHPAQSSAGDLTGVQVPQGEQEAATSASSESRSSSSVIGSTPREQPGPGTPSCSQNPQDNPQLSSEPPSAMASPPRSHCTEGSGSQEEEGPSTSEDTNVPQILRNVLLNDKLCNLVPLLFCKYQKKEQITMEEMLHVVDDEYREHFPLIFRDFCECVSLGLAIEIREVDPPSHTFELVPVMGLTYSGMLDDDAQIIAKVDLLILVLSVIFIKGNRVSEEYLMQQVEKWEILAQMEHIAIEEPWKFISENLVQEEYLVYQQVPNSDPAQFEFLWGPRAYAETSKMKVLEHVAKLNNTDPGSYPHLYAEALNEENAMGRAPKVQDV